MRLALLVALVLGGCMFHTYESEPRARFGYHRPRRVVVIEVAAPSLTPAVAAVRRALDASGRVSVAAEVRADAWSATPTPCEQARAAAPTDGPPVEQIVAVGVTSRAEPTSTCTLLGLLFPTYGGGSDDPRPLGERLTSDDDQGTPGEWRCRWRSYTGAHATATLGVVSYDPATCAPIASAERTAQARAHGADRARDLTDAAQRAVAAMDPGAPAAAVDEVFPPGLEAEPAGAGELALHGPGVERLAVGETYQLRGLVPHPGTQFGSTVMETETLGDVTVRHAQPGGVTVALDPPTLAPVLGNRLMALTYPHEWKLLPLLEVGDLSGDTRRSTTVGGALALRWRYPRAHLAAEAMYALHWAPGFGSRRDEFTAGFGGHLRLGPVIGYALVEAGAVRTPRAADGADAEVARLYGGVVGAELVRGIYRVIVDGRLRRTGGVDADDRPESYQERLLVLSFAQQIE